ncbi:DGQHR domain-containing protein [Lactobacillaceae bacterium Scapto_B20]
MENIFYGVLSKQRNRYIVTGSIKAKDLLRIYTIDEWKPNKPIEEQGSQREPIKAHYRKIGRQFEKNDFWLPTSIVMSESAELLPKNSDNQFARTKDDSFTIDRVESPLDMPIVRVTLKNDHKLRVVDGQHRIKGIEYAINDKHIPGLNDFELPYVLMITKDRIDEIQSFYEINSTPKKVATDLALQLLNELENQRNGKLSAAELNKLIALNASMDLNSDPDSVWYNGISIGKTKDMNVIASSTSFVGALRKLISGKNASKVILNYITSGHEKTTESPNDKDQMGELLSKILVNYWNALKKLLPDAFPDDPEKKQKWVIQKTPGIYSMNLVAGKVLDLMFYRAGIKDFSVENIADFLNKYGETGIKDVTYWRGNNKKAGIVGGEASNANSEKSFNQLAENIFDDIESNFDEANDAQPEF